MDEKALVVAGLCHEVNRAYCESLGDLSQRPWAEAPDWQRESAVKGVEEALADPEATPETLHQAWLEQKQAQGWKYGVLKHEGRKEHPCLVPYAQMPGNQRAKDHLFLGVVRACQALGLV